jgi:hypothetical protein
MFYNHFNKHRHTLFQFVLKWEITSFFLVFKMFKTKYKYLYFHLYKCL